MNRKKWVKPEIFKGPPHYYGESDLVDVIKFLLRNDAIEARRLDKK